MGKDQGAYARTGGLWVVYIEGRLIAVVLTLYDEIKLAYIDPDNRQRKPSPPGVEGFLRRRNSPSPTLPATLLTKFSVLLLLAWMFFVRTSRTSLNPTLTSANFPCNITTTFFACSPSWPSPDLEEFGCCERTRA